MTIQRLVTGTFGRSGGLAATLASKAGLYNLPKSEAICPEVVVKGSLLSLNDRHQPKQATTPSFYRAARGSSLCPPIIFCSVSLYCVE